MLHQERTAAYFVLANVCAESSLVNEDNVFSFDEKWIIPSNNLLDYMHYLDQKCKGGKLILMASFFCL